MPIHTGQDKNGNFYQWGKTGKKYYFKPGDEASRKRARGKAEAQQTAIYSSGWKGDNAMKMKLIKVTKKDSKKADAEYSEEFKEEIKSWKDELWESKRKLETVKYSLDQMQRQLPAENLTSDDKKLDKMVNLAFDDVDRALFKIKDIYALVKNF